MGSQSGVEGHQCSREEHAFPFRCMCTSVVPLPNQSLLSDTPFLVQTTALYKCVSLFQLQIKNSFFLFFSLCISIIVISSLHGNLQCLRLWKQFDCTARRSPISSKHSDKTQTNLEWVSAIKYLSRGRQGNVCEQQQALFLRKATFLSKLFF